MNNCDKTVVKQTIDDFQPAADNKSSDDSVLW